jgi:hypothetical protein
MIPGVTMNKGPANTGVQRASAIGILAIIAASSIGTANVAQAYTDDQKPQTDLGVGPLVDFGAYDITQTGNPAVLVKSTATIAGGYGTVARGTSTGTSVPSAGGTAPFDEYNVAIRFITGGTIGVTGITFQYALDGGESSNSWSAVQALGVSTTLTIPGTGVSFTMGAGTVVLGDTIACQCTRPKSNTSDMTAALEALRVAKIPFETVLIDADADSTMVAALDTWIAARDLEGRYYTGATNCVFKTGAQSDAAYQTALQTAFASTTSTAIFVAADACDVISTVNHVFMRRPAALVVAVRGMSIDVAVDAAFVGTGPLPNCRIYDAKNQPKYHDESKSPGLDDLRLTTLRSWPSQDGVFVNNPKLISPTGSDYVYWQHARLMKLADGITFDELVRQCSIGVHTQPNKVNSNVQNIAEPDAQKIEGSVSKKLQAQLVPVRATSASYKCSRNDDMSSNGPQTLTGTQSIGALRYVKTFVVNTTFV